MIWRTHPRSRAQIVRRVCEALEESYSKPRLGNPKKPLDDLIYIVLSNKTSPAMARKTYIRLKKRFMLWDDVLVAPAYVLRSLLKPAGLAMVKSKQIRAALRMIKKDFGSCDLRYLGKMPENEIQKYLISLPGVSDKVAKCVMMYTQNAEVLPVDSHVHRIAKRLGWTKRKRADQCHDELEALVLPKRRYTFHVDCIVHGRLVCRPENPSCERCCINGYCSYYKRLKGMIE